MNPLVSVIIPAYQCSETLESSVLSALSGTVSEIEAIVVNDSPDDSLDEILNGIVFSSLYAFGGCYAVGRVLKKELRKRFLFTFCILWTLAMVVYSCIAIYVAWTGETIKNLATGSFRVGYAGEQRLYPLYHPVQAGVMAGASLAVALIGCAMTRNKIGKALFILASFIMIVFGILTASRVNHIMNAFVISASICVLVHKNLKTPVKIWKWAFLVCLGIGLLVFLVYIQSYGITAYNLVRNGQLSMIRSAVADESANLTTRGIELNKGIDGFLNGRISIWKALFFTIRKVPNMNILLWGCSADNPMKVFHEASGWADPAHVHNTWLQILLENGIPGALLYLGFTVLLIVRSIQLILNRHCAIWMRMLPIPALACLIGDLTDITCYANTGHPQVTILFLFAGMTIATCQQVRKQKKEQASASS